MNKFKKLMLGAGVMLASAVPSFADDPDPFDTALADIKTAVTTDIGKIVTVVAAVVVAGVVLWAIPLAWRKIRGGVGR